ncbi:1965_t:CDS:2, partial [Racocetra fulgida]
NLEAAEARRKISIECLKDMIKWLEDGGQVGILDASNTTEERRRELCNILTDEEIHVSESLNELSQRADAELSPEGIRYAHNLKNFLLTLREKEKKQRIEDGWGDEDERTLTIWTSPRRRSYQTAKPFEDEGYIVKQRTSIAELNLGEIDGLTVDEIKSIILELEHEKNDVLIIAHETVLKCLYAYLFDQPED